MASVLAIGIVSIVVVVLNKTIVHGRSPLCPEKYHQPDITNAYNKNGNCSIIQFWIQNHEDVMKILSGYFESDDNTWVFGYAGTSARQYFMELGILGNREAILYNQLNSDYAMISLEFTASALPIAIRDYCEQEKFFNFTFM